MTTTPLEAPEAPMSSSFDGTITRGLWAAMVATFPPSSAAGSWLLGSPRPERPISTVGMFDYDAAEGSPSRQVVV